MTLTGLTSSMSLPQYQLLQQLGVAEDTGRGARKFRVSAQSRTRLRS